jgi:AAA+ superfamily predicted ATPase
MCVLTTNLVESIDPAFRRRIPFQIELPKPELPLRVLLWTQFLEQVQAELSSEEIMDLARDYDMTGAHIRNAVIKSAVKALANEGNLTYNLITENADQEYTALGGLVRRRSEED